METSDISFCGKTALNITSEETKEQIINLLDKKEINVTKKKAYILNEKTLENISKNDHYISTRTKGNAYLLFMTKLNDINYCLFVDKKINEGYKYPRILTTKFRFSNHIFDGTVFDGELIKKKSVGSLL